MRKRERGHRGYAEIHQVDEWGIARGTACLVSLVLTRTPACCWKACPREWPREGTGTAGRDVCLVQRQQGSAQGEAQTEGNRDARGMTMAQDQSLVQPCTREKRGTDARVRRADLYVLPYRCLAARRASHWEPSSCRTQTFACTPRSAQYCDRRERCVSESRGLRQRRD